MFVEIWIRIPSNRPFDIVFNPSELTCTKNAPNHSFFLNYYYYSRPEFKMSCWAIRGWLNSWQITSHSSISCCITSLMTVEIVNMRCCSESAIFLKQKECHYKSWLLDDICIDLNHWADERKFIKLWSKLSCAEILGTWYDPGRLNGRQLQSYGRAQN